jgi:hypothetical protein
MPIAGVRAGESLQDPGYPGLNLEIFGDVKTVVIKQKIMIEHMPECNGGCQ